MKQKIVGNDVLGVPKKVLSILLSLCMLLSITAGLDFSAYADLQDENFIFTINNNGTLCVKKYIGNSVFAEIPSEYNKRKVSVIGEDAFDGCSNLIQITLPSGISEIGLGAFSGCESLSIINIPNTVKSIGPAAFFECKSLTSITLSNRMTYISDLAFAYCESLSDITMPNSIKSIAFRAFVCCTSLSSVTIPDSVLDIGDGAFSYCTSLSELKIPNNVISIGKGAFSECNSLKSVSIGTGLTKLPEQAFGNCTQLKKISIPKNIKSIDNDTFTGSDYLVIYCYDNSYTYQFAKLKGIPVELLLCNNHNYVFLSEMPANCQVTGEIKYICNICGEIMIQTTAKTSHNYKNKVTKATLTKNGKIVPTCTVCGATKTATTIYSLKTFALSPKAYTYDGKAKKPTVTVKDSKGNKISGSNYTVKYANNTKVGNATVKVTFKDNYSGSKTLTFKINPKGTAITKLKNAKKGFTVKWNKRTTQTTGYQVQIATNSKFTSGKKTYTISKNSTTSKRITGLKGKKKYYVRVRTYKTVNGTKYYSGWSKAKSVTTRK